MRGKNNNKRLTFFILIVGKFHGEIKKKRAARKIE